MLKSIKLAEVIDKKNLNFTSNVKFQLRDLQIFSENALEWLMLEHYQFSSRNPGFLLTAANTTGLFCDKRIKNELERNFKEEENHAKIYKKSLYEIGSDVETHIEFKPTTDFFYQLENLISRCPSQTLGTMYATETAAIFEHEVFFDISKEICNRRKMNWEKSRLKAFHDLHLNGVEQSHKDELGIFLDATDEVSHSEKLGELINHDKLFIGANLAIDSMDKWWQALLSHANAISR